MEMTVRGRSKIHLLAFVTTFTVCIIVIQTLWITGNSGAGVSSSERSPGMQFTDLMEKEFQRRRERYMDVCAVENSGTVAELLIHANSTSGLAICHTPKVGCTFWKRILTFLHSKRRRWKSPFEIDRYTVHHAPTIKIHHLYDSDFVKKRISNFTRVVFGRDPYSRLWSAYVDKILLPDSWRDHGLGIYRYRNLGNVPCPLNITFEDFLHYALFKMPDRHWAPLNTFCNPCRLYPKYIGKMETFSRDVAYILSQNGLGHLLDNQHTDNHVEDEMSILIDYHFKVHEAREINKKCLTLTGLAERLWRVFQLNGYISFTNTFPERSLRTSLDGADFWKARNIVTNMFVDHYRNNTTPKTEMKSQRKSVITNAYKKIPLPLRDAISKLYSQDFKLYGYESRPKDIFS